MLAPSSSLVLLLVFLLIVPGLFGGLPSVITQSFFDYVNPQTSTTYPAFHQILMLVFYVITFGLQQLISTSGLPPLVLAGVGTVYLFRSSRPSAEQALYRLRLCGSGDAAFRPRRALIGPKR